MIAQVQAPVVAGVETVAAGRLKAGAVLGNHFVDPDAGIALDLLLLQPEQITELKGGESITDTAVGERMR